MPKSKRDSRWNKTSIRFPTHNTREIHQKIPTIREDLACIDLTLDKWCNYIWLVTSRESQWGFGLIAHTLGVKTVFLPLKRRIQTQLLRILSQMAYLRLNREMRAEIYKQVRMTPHKTISLRIPIHRILRKLNRSAFLRRVNNSLKRVGYPKKLPSRSWPLNMCLLSNSSLRSTGHHFDNWMLTH